MNIRTRYEPYAPLPMMWTAVDDDTYDCDCDQDGYFSIEPIGMGSTREAAVTDLLEQIAAKNLREAERTDAATMRMLTKVYQHELPFKHVHQFAAFIGVPAEVAP